MINIDYFTKWIELDDEIKNQGTTDFVTKYLPLNSYNNIFISNDIKLNRMFYIEFSDGVIANYKPKKINGIDIIVKKNNNLDKDKTYLVLSNVEKKLDDAFIAFSSLIFDSLFGSVSENDTLVKLEDALDNYHNFFGFKKELSKENEQGLIAELMYLKDLIVKSGESSVANWFGCEKNKRDFIFSDYGVEIKSTRNQEQIIINVSNENQLDPGKGKLYIKLYIFDENDTGYNVSHFIREIDGLLNDFEYKKMFYAKLMMREIDPYNYDGKYIFSLEKTKTYIVDDKFPKITKDTIPSNAYDVKYKLNISGIKSIEEV